MPVNDKEIEAMMKEGDRGGSGKMTFTEFATMMGTKIASMDAPKAVLEALECFDTGNNPNQRRRIKNFELTVIFWNKKRELGFTQESNSPEFSAEEQASSSNKTSPPS